MDRRLKLSDITDFTNTSFYPLCFCLILLSICLPAFCDSSVILQNDSIEPTYNKRISGILGFRNFLGKLSSKTSRDMFTKDFEDEFYSPFLAKLNQRINDLSDLKSKGKFS